MHPVLVPIHLAIGLLLFITPLAAADQVRSLVTQAAQLSDSAQTKADFTQIVTICQQASALSLSNPQTEYFTQLEAWARNKRGELLAVEALQTGDLRQIEKLEAAALEDFQKAVQKNPKHWQAIHNRGLSYALLGETQKALADFELALQLNPKFETARYNKAEMLYELGQFAQALKQYQQVLQLTPDDVGATTGQAHCLYYLEKYEEALVAYTAAVELAPEDPLVHANRADAYSDLGYWRQAIVDYQKALTLDRNLARAQQGLAWILATCPDNQLRKPELALRFATAAASQAAEPDFRYEDTLAAAQAAMGQFDAARQRLSKVIEAAPAAQRPFLEHRLALYEKRQPYREPTR